MAGRVGISAEFDVGTDGGVVDMSFGSLENRKGSVKKDTLESLWGL
jgi:hypothetical protein